VIACVLAPQSEIQYLLPRTGTATLARNTSEFARQLSIMLVADWCGDPFRFSHY
jgi:hypothetical protein